MRNKKGFFAVSIIFSFFIIFLMLISMNLTAYAQNRILLGQVKRDIKSVTKLQIKNKLVICKRAEMLHQGYCASADGVGCKGAGISDTTIINYGNIYDDTVGGIVGEKYGVSGVTNVGDAFDCDVEGGIFDCDDASCQNKTAERFYYLGDEGTSSVFVYYKNISTSNYTNAPATLATLTNSWTNIKNNGQIKLAPLSLISAGCLTNGALDIAGKCKFLLEESYYYDATAKPYYWLSNATNDGYVLDTSNATLPAKDKNSTDVGIRPAIIIPRDRVQVYYN